MAKSWILSFAAFTAFTAALLIQGASSATFTFENNCDHTVWPATLTGAGTAPLAKTGFVLAPGAAFSLDAPPNWSGRMWARVTCSTDTSGKFSCLTGDCGSGQLECNGSGGAPPTTLVEFTLNGADRKDFYDVSNVDGFDVPVAVQPRNVTGCNTTACATDINMLCPPELQLRPPSGAVVGCKSACVAFGSDEYCCTGAFGEPKTCKPTKYSEIFKNACPLAYSYPYDDATSTFTCVGANYLITYCPSPLA